MENHFINLHSTTSNFAEMKEFFFLKPTEMYALFSSCFINLQVDFGGAESYREK